MGGRRAPVVSAWESASLLVLLAEMGVVVEREADMIRVVMLACTLLPW
jgi:hypothetical protein